MEPLYNKGAMKKTKYIFTVDDVDVMNVELCGGHSSTFVEIVRTYLANAHDVAFDMIGAERIVGHEAEQPEHL